MQTPIDGPVAFNSWNENNPAETAGQHAAFAVGLIAAMNMARHETHSIMIECGFCTDFQGIAMPKAKEPSYSRCSIFVESSIALYTGSGHTHTFPRNSRVQILMLAPLVAHTHTNLSAQSLQKS